MKLRMKRYYPIILVLILITTLLSVLMGNQRVIAYTFTSENETTATADIISDSAYTITNTIALFDDSQVHSIQIMMEEEDYALMQTTYQETGEKDYFHADIIIDGVQVNNVGIRLKGNASLRSALGGMGEMGGKGRNPGAGNGAVPPENGIERPVRPEMGGGIAPPAAGEIPDAALPGMKAGDGQVSVNVKIPYLISFDKFEDGQTYQGYSSIAIRNYGTKYDETMLAEPLTNDVFQFMGLPATETVFTGVAVNDGTERLYVISEILDEAYLEEYFPGTSGVLYKAEIGASLTYAGDDPSNYSNSFTQETRENDADMAPLIEFMKFLRTSGN